MSALVVPVGKQRDFILTKPARINLLTGSVRSTKTWAVNLKVLKDIVSLPEGNILFVGNTGTSLYRNVLSQIRIWWASRISRCILAKRNARYLVGLFGLKAQII